MMFDTKDVIDDILSHMSPQGEDGYLGIVTPSMVCYHLHDADEYGSEGDAFVIDDNGHYEKIKIEKLRKKRCEWTMQGKTFSLGTAYITYNDFTDENGEEMTEVYITLQNAHGESKRFDDDFEKNIKKFYGLDKDSTKAFYQELLAHQSNKPMNIFFVK